MANQAGPGPIRSTYCDRTKTQKLTALLNFHERSPTNRAELIDKIPRLTWNQPSTCRHFTILLPPQVSRYIMGTTPNKMLEQIQDFPSSVVAVRANCTVTKEDYGAVLFPLIDQVLKDHDKVRFLYHVGPDFKGFTAGAMWDDAKAGFKHIKHWEKAALVTDVGWLQKTSHVLGFMQPGKFKIYPNSDMQAAKDWILAD